VLKGGEIGEEVHGSKGASSSSSFIGLMRVVVLTGGDR
jgi:hypothetical protein